MTYLRGCVVANADWAVIPLISLTTMEDDGVRINGGVCVVPLR